MGYDAPTSYAELIAPRYAPIADALVEAARLRQKDDVLELGAGTGLVTRRVSPRVRSLVATDLAPGMLDVARRSVRRAGCLSFVVADYNAPLPFLDSSFDLVLSGLTYVQDRPAALTEVVRVLKPNGRLALAMWGPVYQEFRILADAVESIGRPRLPSPGPGRAVRRIERAGFRSVKRHDFNLTNEFESVDDYLAYRRGFGKPAGATNAFYERYLRALHRRASLDATGDGPFTLGWRLTVITAHRA
jgi:Methylase involved in ubiquinone/menaquinone biosynthesis